MGLGVWAAGQQGSKLSMRAFTTTRETPCTDTVVLSPDPSALTASTLSVTAPITQHGTENKDTCDYEERTNMTHFKCID